MQTALDTASIARVIASKQSCVRQPYDLSFKPRIRCHFVQATRDLLKLITAVLEVDQEHDGTTYTYGDLCIRDPLNECKSTG